MTPTASFPAGGASTVAMRKEASELRKTLKPLLEKRRRARINDCLNQLKNLILPLMGKDKCRYSKFEKADILEMTVKFLTDVPKTASNDVAVGYSEGFDACLQRVSALLPRTSLDGEASARVCDFIQQALRSSSPACHACSPRTSGALSPTQHEHDGSSTLRKWIDITRREKRASVAPQRAADAPQVSAQPMWRPW